MTLQEIRVPHLDTYNFGVGVDRLSGMAMNQVVNPTLSPPTFAVGPKQTFVVSRVSTTHDLEQKLGIDISASAGCASFGAGVSARFKFSSESNVHSASLFLTISATVNLADLSIDDCVLTAAAGQQVDRPDIFDARYGNMFARACQRGGIFVGLMSIETYGDDEASSIESELHGSYGMFSADAKVNFSKVTSDHNATVYCSIYTEGGPAVQLHHPDNPVELLELANTWLQAMSDHPNDYAQPLQWTLSPISIAEGPLPLNQADIEHVQDVLTFCAQERVTLLDQLNQLNWWGRHQDMYDWTGSTTPEQIAESARATQIDLQTVSNCASKAIDSPKQATMPAEYATAQVPPSKYPLSQPLPVGPKPLKRTDDASVARGKVIAEQDPLSVELSNQQTDEPSQRGFYIGMAVAEGQTLPGPGKQAIHESLDPTERRGFEIAVQFSLERNKNAEFATMGAAVAKENPIVAKARADGPNAFYRLGFDIASGLYGDPALGAKGYTSEGPGAQGIHDSLEGAGQSGFAASMKLHLGPPPLKRQG